jgi:hypothetical protein
MMKPELFAKFGRGLWGTIAQHLPSTKGRKANVGKESALWKRNATNKLRNAIEQRNTLLSSSSYKTTR